ncbi:MAG: hypothetical protein FWB85_05640 [Chitinispirillia bacterium]|nr:hypothetical protein [Chitinispirillia bacterium]MCL2241693.1 hypothetical protein [Chitinispirillia bacterium]
MKKALKTAVFTLSLALFAQAATVPLQNMTPLSLGVEYMHTLNGHAGLFDFDSSALGSHLLRLHYSPAEWLRFSAGFGGSVSYAEPFIKGSNANASATAGLGLYTPRLFDLMRVTAGYDGYYLRAAEKYQLIHSSAVRDSTGRVIDTTRTGDFREGYTAAMLHTPYLGLIFHAGRFADIEIGGIYQIFEITKKSRESFNAAEVSNTTNTFLGTPNFEDMDSRGIEKIQEQFRLYAALTLHERESGAYLTGGFSYAITDQQAENRSRLTDFSFWGQIGIIMKENRGTAGRRHGRHQGSYADLITRQELMAGDLNRDIVRDRERHAEYLKKCKNHKHDANNSCIVDKKGNFIPTERDPRLRRGKNVCHPEEEVSAAEIEGDTDITIADTGE